MPGFVFSISSHIHGAPGGEDTQAECRKCASECEPGVCTSLRAFLSDHVWGVTPVYPLGSMGTRGVL